jgi:ribosomal protein L37AE/L43A
MRKEKEILENIDNFLSGKITVEKFWNVSMNLRKSPFKPWETALWKENRGKKLSDCCEKCGSKENLTIQHIWHPKSYKEYFKEVKEELSYSEEFSLYKKKLKEENLIPTTIEKQVCPFCKNEALTRNKGLWKCQDKRTERLRVKVKPRKGEKVIYSSNNHCYIRLSKGSGCGESFKDPRLITKTVKKVDTKFVDKQILSYIRTKATSKWLVGFMKYINLEEGTFYTACGECAYKEDYKNGLIQKALNRESIRNQQPTQKAEFKPSIRRRRV